MYVRIQDNQTVFSIQQRKTLRYLFIGSCFLRRCPRTMAFDIQPTHRYGIREIGNTCRKKKSRLGIKERKLKIVHKTTIIDLSMEAFSPLVPLHLKLPCVFLPLIAQKGEIQLLFLHPGFLELYNPHASRREHDNAYKHHLHRVAIIKIGDLLFHLVISF